MSNRTYEQYCAIATSLDSIGDRWALLVIRELLAGPKRYTDLLDGLPGISTDMLAARFRGLEAAGIVERRTLPPPAASKVYQLTADGAELEPVLIALARWGARRMPSAQHGEFRLHWIESSLRSMFREGVKRVSVTVDFCVGDERLRANVRDGTLRFEHDPSGPADVVITGDAAGVVALARGPDSRAAVLANGQVTVDGDARAIDDLQRVFGLEQPSVQ